MINIVEHHRAVEISKMRKLMKYDQAQFERDWSECLACAVLLASGAHHSLERIIESNFQRILAYMANNPDARPFSGVEFGAKQQEEA